MSNIGRLTLKSGLDVGIRPYRPGADDPIIYAPWCNHIRRVEPFSGFSTDDFRHHKSHVLEALVAQNPPTVICHAQHHNVVLGWLCGCGMEQVLHFLFVKSEFRGNGVAAALMGIEYPYLGDMPLYYTHRSRQSTALAEKWGLTYNPYRTARYSADLLG